MTASPAVQAIRPQVRWVRLLAFTQDIVLVVAMVFFCVLHAGNIAAGNLASIPFVIEYLLLAGLFITRRRSNATSSRALDWVVAAIGTWAPLAFQLHDNGPGWLEAVGFTVQLIGLSLAIVCIFGLGRSFGIVAANRGLKTRGPYQIVRHPIYACHFITNTGFLLVNPHWLNVAIFAFAFGAQVLRMRAEERVLTESGNYAEYAAEVRYRLIPGVY